MNKTLLIDADPCDRLRIEPSFRWPSHVVTTLDISLWEIAGKALEFPIYKLLGTYREQMLVYASFI